MYKKLNEFYTTDIKNNPQEIFKILHKIINFNYGSIYLSDKPEYSYNTKENSTNFLENELKYLNTVFGKIIIGKSSTFTTEEINIFNTCTLIIANLIKDIEISKILNLQVRALQEGIFEKDEAYQIEKNKNDFFSNFSHELRTPLNSIINSSEILSEKFLGDLNEKQLEYINDIRVSGLYLLGMINDILDMTKLEAKSMKLNKTTFLLSQITNEVYNIINPMAVKKNIVIELHYDNDIEILADYAKIQQVLFNIITNAIKYTNENGKISISFSNNKNYASISIKDNGIGIDKKYHKKIFKKFTQLNSAKNSNGLGLTISQELIKLHRGIISLESEPNKGSNFTIQLPLS